MPINDDLPILSWVEKIFAYKDKQDKLHYVSVINSARGVELLEHCRIAYTSTDIVTAINGLKNGFYAVGRALAAFNLYMADGSPDETLAEINKKLKIIHKDLHWGNIFIHEKPKKWVEKGWKQDAETEYWKWQWEEAHSKERRNELGEQKKQHQIDIEKNVDIQSNPYRIYLIDNETMMSSEDAEPFKPYPGVTRDDNIGEQLYRLYAQAMFARKIILKDEGSIDKDMAIIGGFIEGYASQFSKRQKDSIIHDMIDKFIAIHNFALEAWNQNYDYRNLFQKHLHRHISKLSLEEQRLFIWKLKEINKRLKAFQE